MRRAPLWLIAVAAVPALASAQSIVGGDPASPSDYPATGVITAGTRLRCTGTLIAPDVVLTAAHCAEPPEIGHLDFTLDPDLGDGITAPVRALVAHQHPDFDPSARYIDLTAARHDIGIVILTEPIEVRMERVDPSRVLEPGVELGLCGYGRTEWTTAVAGAKRTATVMLDQLTSHEFATASVGPQPCGGDSGGPLFDQTGESQTIVGVVSRAYGTSPYCDSGAIITRTAPYVDWIAEASEDRDVGCGGGFGLPLLVIGAGRAKSRRRR